MAWTVHQAAQNNGERSGAVTASERMSAESCGKGFARDVWAGRGRAYSASIWYVSPLTSTSAAAEG